MERRTPIWIIPEPANGSHLPTVSNGTSDKYPVSSPFLVGVQSKFRRKYYHKLVFAILIVIILILLLTVFILSFKSHKSTKCDTKECLRIASDLLESMDMTADPCDDFYQFTCGNWEEEHPRPDALASYDWFSDKQRKVSRHIRTFLQQNITETEPEAVKKTKLLYRACTDTIALENQGLEPILHYFKLFDLPPIPAMLNKSLVNATGYEFDWLSSIVKIKRIMGMDVMIGLDIFPDPTNRTNNRIAMGTPDSGRVLPFNDDKWYKRLNEAKRKILLRSAEGAEDAADSPFNEEDDDGDDEEERDISKIKTTSDALTMYIRKVSAQIMKGIDSEIDTKQNIGLLNAAAVKTVAITKDLNKYNEEALNLTKASDYDDETLDLSVSDMQKYTDESISPKTLPIWKRYLLLLFEGSEGKFNVESDKVLTSVADMKYLQRLTEFLNEVDIKALEFFIWWSVVEELTPHSIIALRQLYYDYVRILMKTEGTTSRSLYCAGGINNMMGMAVSYSMASEKFNDETRPKVETMLSNIRHAFNNLVHKTGWMDVQTKKQTLEKLLSMKSLIGFPEWIRNKTTLDEYYAQIEANETTHLQNMMGILTWQMKKKLDELNTKHEFGWAVTPLQVNAYHTFQANAITVPLAILQYPFYELGLEALNYGAIGTILGHELTHGFDDNGRMFDKSGNKRQWWTNETIEEYVNRTTCFVKQYSEYYISEVEAHIDGEMTLGENIADNGGIREAYNAYQIYRKQNGSEIPLVGLEQFTHDQLFFISFGRLWCSTETTASLSYALEDTHCPGSIRLRGVLTNSPEFSQTFGCKKGSKMFPSEKRCRLW